jgi:hypothetical protein
LEKTTGDETIMTDKIQAKTSDLLSEDFDNFMARATRQLAREMALEEDRLIKQGLADLLAGREPTISEILVMARYGRFECIMHPSGWRTYTLDGAPIVSFGIADYSLRNASANTLCTSADGAPTVIFGIADYSLRNAGANTLCTSAPYVMRDWPPNTKAPKRKPMRTPRENLILELYSQLLADNVEDEASVDIMYALSKHPCVQAELSKRRGEETANGEDAICIKVVEAKENEK